MRRCRLHPTMCMEVKRLSDRAACLLEVLSFSLSLSSRDEIGNGAVIEVLKTTRCGYVTRVIAIGHRERAVKQETYAPP